MKGGEFMGESVKYKDDHTSSRPKRETKKRGFYMRMTETELNSLDILSYECDETKTEVMRKAFKMYHDFMKNRL